MANTFVFDDDEPKPDSGASAPEPPAPGQPDGSEGNNRTFLIAAIILGAIVLLSLVCMAVYALLILPGQKASAQATSAANSVALTQSADFQQQTEAAASFTATPLPSDTPTFVPTDTMVVVFASATPSTVPTSDPATATVEALQTQLAESQATSSAKNPSQAGAQAGTASAAGTAGTPGTTGTPDPKQLAKTGFADEVGLPGLFIISIVLVAIILLVRRLRQSPLAR